VTIVDNEVVDNTQIKYYADGESELVLSPFDNYIKFKIAKMNGDDIIAISLESVDKVILNLGKIAIENTLSYGNVELGEGEIMFKVDQKTINLLVARESGYALSIVNGLDKTLIHHGSWSVLDI